MSLYFLVGFVPWLFFSPAVKVAGRSRAATSRARANGLMIADRPDFAAGLGTACVAGDRAR